MAEKKKPIGQILLERGIINEDQLNTALDRQQYWGRRLGENLVSLGFISEKQLTKILGEIYRIPTVDIRTAPVSKEALEMVPEEFCRKHRLIPIKVKSIEGKNQLVVALSDPSNVEAIDELRFLVKIPVFEVLSPVSDINDVLNRYFQGIEATEFELVREVTLSRIKEDVEAEIIPETKGKLDEPKEDPSPADRIEKRFHSLIFLLVNKELISEEEGRRLLSL